MSPRVIISTDIGGNDKDDAQSLIHAVLYADQIDYRGFIGTSTDARNVDAITPMNQIIDAYETDLPNLRTGGDYPDAEVLRSLITQGGTGDAPDWPGGLNDGVQLIIDEARAASPDDPLYVLTWGPVHDAARALYEAPDIVENVRVISISGLTQDRNNPDAYNWMVDSIQTDPAYADLWWIVDLQAHRGMHLSEDGVQDPSLNLAWVEENVAGKGALGTLFYDEFTQDLYFPGSVSGLKMGDSPSLLYLLDQMDDNDPTLASWGGQFERWDIGTNTWLDTSDPDMELGAYRGAQSVFMHREEVWGEFALLLDIAANGLPETGEETGGGTGEETGGGTDDETGGTVTGDGTGEETGGTETGGGLGEETGGTETGGETGGSETGGGTGEETGGTETGGETGAETGGSETGGSTNGGGETFGTIEDPAPAFEEFGTASAEKMLGSGGIDLIHADAGDDSIIGRGDDDWLDGGAGNDWIKAGAGDDHVLHVLSENAGMSDFYHGSDGTDTLYIFGTAAELSDAGLQADLSNLESFLQQKADPGNTGGDVFDFASTGISLRAFERVELVQTDGGSATGSGPREETSGGTDEETGGTETGGGTGEETGGTETGSGAGEETDGSVTGGETGDEAGDSETGGGTGDEAGGSGTGGGTGEGPGGSESSDGTGEETGGDAGEVTGDGAAPSGPAPIAWDVRGDATGSKFFGTGGVDRIHAGAGDDSIIGRGDDDWLSGGAGDDWIKAGAGDDHLVHVLADNAGSTDKYLGADGTDTLYLFGTEEEFADAALQGDLAALAQIIDATGDLGKNGGTLHTMSSIGVSVRDIEAVELILVDSLG